MDIPVKQVPLPALRRMPSYYQYLKKVQAKGRNVISCTHISGDLGLDPTQVRKDLAHTGIQGKPKVGYSVSALILAIQNFLNWENPNDAFLVGVGNLGSALLGYQGFKHYGLNIVAAFDSDSSKIGQIIQGVPVLSLDKLPDLARRMHILLGVITVPGEAAQGVANLMAKGGVQAIWNFAPAQLDVPEGVLVQNEDLATGLAMLCRYLKPSEQPAKEVL